MWLVLFLCGAWKNPFCELENRHGQSTERKVLEKLSCINIGSILLPSLLTSLPPIDIDLTLPREGIRLGLDYQLIPVPIQNPTSNPISMPTCMTLSPLLVEGKAGCLSFQTNPSFRLVSKRSRSSIRMPQPITYEGSPKTRGYLVQN